MEPDSRMGTSRPAIHPGACRVVSSHGSVVLGLISASPSLLAAWARVLRKKLPGTTRQAASEMSRQTRESSSSYSAE